MVERHYPNLMHAPVVLALTTVLRPFLPVYSDVAAFLGARVDGGFNLPDEGPFYPPGDA